MSGHSEAPSTKSLYLILISTFFFGILTGVIIYLQNNTGGEGDGDLDMHTSGFEVLAYSYGGCERIGCASYRLIQDGTYTYMPHEKGFENKKIEGELSKDDLNNIKKAISNINFEALKNLKFKGNCPSEYDGIAFRYDITYKGTRHSFDSCVEQLDSEALFEALGTFFQNIPIDKK